MWRMSLKENRKNKVEGRKMGPPGSAPGTEWLPGPLESPSVNVGQRPAPSVPEEVGRGYHKHSRGSRHSCPGKAPLLMEPPHPHRQLFFPCPKLTCTVIRLCRVWLGPGLSSQNFSVTWDLGGGPRPWKYLAKSERERING